MSQTPSIFFFLKCHWEYCNAIGCVRMTQSFSSSGMASSHFQYLVRVMWLANIHTHLGQSSSCECSACIKWHLVFFSFFEQHCSQIRFRTIVLNIPIRLISSLTSCSPKVQPLETHLPAEIAFRTTPLFNLEWHWLLLIEYHLSPFAQYGKWDTRYAVFQLRRRRRYIFKIPCTSRAPPLTDDCLSSVMSLRVAHNEPIRAKAFPQAALWRARARVLSLLVFWTDHHSVNTTTQRALQSNRKYQPQISSRWMLFFSCQLPIAIGRREKRLDVGWVAKLYVAFSTTPFVGPPRCAIHLLLYPSLVPDQSYDLSYTVVLVSKFSEWN